MFMRLIMGIVANKLVVVIVADKKEGAHQFGTPLLYKTHNN